MTKAAENDSKWMTEKPNYLTFYEAHKITEPRN